MKPTNHKIENSEESNSVDKTGIQKMVNFTDERDGKSYRTVKIGDQIIMAENLAFRPIFGVYYAYDEKHAKVAKYGYLYDWETAKKIADNIKGWHLPSKEEWEAIYKQSGKDKLEVYKFLNGYGADGFNALYGGYLSDLGTFICAGERAGFWSSTKQDNNHAWGFLMNEQEKDISIVPFDCKCGLSIRLFKDK